MRKDWLRTFLFRSIFVSAINSYTMFSRAIVVLCLALLPTGIMAQCSAMISYSSNCLTVQFAGIVQGTVGPNTMYYWWFDDGGNNSSQLNPVYTFSSGGTYDVSFSLYDPSSGCSDSTTIQVTVAPCNCTADFTWMDTLGYTYFISSTTASGPSYFWDFGDGNNSTQQNPSHNYANAGTYTVCLYVYDSLQNFCDSACHTVTVQGSSWCNADFTWFDTLGFCYFYSNTTLASAMFAWDFGDGNYSNQPNPAHQYSVPGFYTVCLFVYDSMQIFCDSTCYTIHVQFVSVNEENVLQESMWAGPNPADDAIMLSFFAPATGVATISLFDAAGRNALQETATVNTSGQTKLYINTAELPQGIYLVKLEMNGTVAWKKIALTHQ